MIKTPKKDLHIYIDEWLYKKFKAYCEEWNLSASEEVRNLIYQALRDNEKHSDTMVK